MLYQREQKSRGSKSKWIGAADSAKKVSPAYGKCQISCTSNFHLKVCSNKKILEIFSEPEKWQKSLFRKLKKPQWLQTQLVILTLQLIKQMKTICLWKRLFVEPRLKELAIGRVAGGSAAVVPSTSASGFVELAWCSSGPCSGHTGTGSMPLVLQVVANLSGLSSWTQTAHVCTKWKEA